jgi:acyl transferase domain-containing protein/acyl carrier protein
MEFEHNQSDIAIIGVDGVMPQSENLDIFWEHLRDGHDLITEIPESRWDWRALFGDPIRGSNQTRAKWGSFISHVSQFDAQFFNILPFEARFMDPQHRLLLQVIWGTIESAGYRVSDLSGSNTGVFIGVLNSDYEDLLRARTDEVDAYALTGVSHTMLTNRVSYLFDFRGPSEPVNTACSSSLVAVSRGVDAIRQGRCDLALVGGVNLILSPLHQIAASKAGFLCDDGRCKSFDQRANGYVRGEGIATILLKALSKAKEDGDPIFAVIKGAAVNHGGKAHSLTAPNPRSQSEVIIMAHEQANVSPDTVDYIETHGSGTTLGDTVEIGGLKRAFKHLYKQWQLDASNKHRCFIGSVKSNVGHLESAAGIAGLVKVIQSLRHNLIPASLHFEKPNPQCELNKGPFEVADKAMSWNNKHINGQWIPRRAGVSSFGYGGVNAHVVLEEFVDNKLMPACNDIANRPFQIIPLSAKSDAQLVRYVKSLLEFLERSKNIDNQSYAFNLEQFAYTLQVGREEFECRLVFLEQSIDDLVLSLQCWLENELNVSDEEKKTHKNGGNVEPVKNKIDKNLCEWDDTVFGQSLELPITFVFSGVGEHYVNISLDLYLQQPTFRQVLDECCDTLYATLNCDIREILFSKENAGAALEKNTLDLRAMLARRNKGVDNSPIFHTQYAQPIVFVIEYALVALLGSWGIKPAMLAGYSLGEYTAACVAGVFSLDDALMLVATRAKLIQKLPAGSMLAVSAAPNKLEMYLSENVNLSIVNGPNNTILAGPIIDIEQVSARLQKDNIACRLLDTSHAFHSSMMQSIRGEYEALIAKIKLSPPRIPLLSNVTGTWMTNEQAVTPEYWGQHLCLTVKFSDQIQEMIKEESSLMMEIGPGQTLSTFIKQHTDFTKEKINRVVSTLPSQFERKNENQYILNSVAKLWAVGRRIDWRCLHSNSVDGSAIRRLSLPRYPFEDESHWAKFTKDDSMFSAKKRHINEWFYHSVWKPSGINRSAGDNYPTCCLVLSDDKNLMLQLDRQVNSLLERKKLPKCEFVYATSANQYKKTNKGEFQLNPSKEGDYRELINSLCAEGRQPTMIVNTWMLTAEGQASQTNSEDFSRQFTYGFYSVIYLARIMSTTSSLSHVPVMVLGREFLADSFDAVNPGKQTALAACQCVLQEYPQLVFRAVDFEIKSTDTQVLGYLVTEMFLDSKQEPLQIAYRNNQRQQLDFEPVTMDSLSIGDDSLAFLPEKEILKTGGVYVITGGLGKIGVILARYLAQHFSANIALVNRAVLPERSQWKALLSDPIPESKTLLVKLQEIQAIEELGGNVFTYSADVSDSEQMKRVIAHVQDQMGSINGVIHAAGELHTNSFQTIQFIDNETTDKHVSSKVAGAFVLAESLQNIELDFCLLMSSLSSYLGGLGLAAYSASNQALDAFVVQQNTQQEKQRCKQNWISVNWDYWLTDSQNPASENTSQGSTLGEFSMTPEDGAKAFHLSINSGSPRIIVSVGELTSRYRRWGTREGLLQAQLKQRNALAEVARKRESSGVRSQYIPASGQLEQTIVTIWEETLGMEKISATDNFFDLGGNSLIGMQILIKLKNHLGREVEPLLIFEAPTARMLAKCLQDDGNQRALLGETNCSNNLSKKLKERRKQVKFNSEDSDIAVISMNGRFPGANSVEQFWNNLLEGTESISHFSDAELLEYGTQPELLQRVDFIKAKPVIENVDLFDAAFFGYTPFEASIMDPQSRLMLECAWELLEKSGYDSEQYPGLIGVFAGSNVSTYWLKWLSDSNVVAKVDKTQMVVGNDKDALPTTISYKLNLRGPSVAVQTFCSTSLSAVHIAKMSLLSGECDLALAGASCIQMPYKEGYLYQEGGQGSSDGSTRTFDKSANGTVFGDGIGLVLLKRLRDALVDGDQVHAVIKGSAMNNDGALKIGYTAPSIQGQSDVVVQALENAQVDPENIHYIEAHGTATPLGDPIEVAALTRAYRAHTDKVGFCQLGSVKTNIGHLNHAAGAAGLIKAVHVVKEGVIPATLHFSEPNAKLALDSSPFKVNNARIAWPGNNNNPRLAGVNSLGIGGTNIHMIVEQAPMLEKSGPSRDYQLLVLSARTNEALLSQQRNFLQFLKQNKSELGHLNHWADVAYTLKVGRRRFDCRLSLVCKTVEQTIEQLSASLAAGERLLSVAAPGNSRTVEPSASYIFPNAGDQYFEMPNTLYQMEPIFRENFERCCQIFEDIAGVDPRINLFAAQSSAKENNHSDNLLYLHSAYFCVEYALAKLLMFWGVLPSAMIGDGLGEYVAACLAGTLSLQDTIKLVADRACIMRQFPEQDIADVAIKKHKKVLESVKFQKPIIPYLSSVTGSWADQELVAKPQYWIQLLCDSVLLNESITVLMDNKAQVLIEMGPGNNLSSIIKKHPCCSPAQSKRILATLKTHNGGSDDQRNLLESLGKLWVLGLTPDWANFYRDEKRSRVLLPTYPFEQKSHWLESVFPVKGLISRDQQDEKYPLEQWFYQPVWETKTRLDESVAEEVSKNNSVSTWLIFRAEQALDHAIVECLEAQRCQVVSVYAGSCFERLTTDISSIDKEVGSLGWKINSENPKDFSELINLLVDSGLTPSRVIYGWALKKQSSDKSITDYFNSLFYLTQAISRCLDELPVKLYTLTHKMQYIEPSDRGQAYSSLLVGPTKAIASECKSIQTVLIDLDLDEEISSFLPMLMNQLHADITDNEVVVRKGNCWIKHLSNVKVPSVNSTVIKRHGTYLITGAFGGLGYAMANYLAKNYQANLILISRSPLAYSAKVVELEELGASVLVGAADVSDYGAMTAIVSQAYAQFGTINGVFHIAGVPGEGVIALKTQQQVDEVLKPKVQGTLVIDRVIDITTLDFMMLYSSIASLTGGVGEVDYCSANAYQNSYAQFAQNHYKTPVVSMVWGPWKWHDWQSKIEKTIPEIGNAIQKFRNELGITFDEGMQAVIQGLSLNLPVLVVIPRELEFIEQKIQNIADVHKTAITVGFTANNNNVLIDSSALFKRPQNRSELENYLLSSWKGYLGYDHISIHDNFFDLGGNSLVGMQLAATLQQQIGVKLNIVSLFEAPTIASLCDLLLEKIQSLPKVDKKERARPSQPENSQPQNNQPKNKHTHADIAIIAMNGRFPGADSMAQFWKNICNGVESVTHFSDHQLRDARVSQALIDNPRYVKSRPVIEGIDQFDASFFGYSDEQARLIDPQQRLFLECSWELMEMAGYDCQSYDGLIGVYSGSMISTYLLHMLQDSQIKNADNLTDIVRFNEQDGLCTAVSYKLNLRGPSFTVQTYCSSSLVAVHLACQSLLIHESDMAIAGGVSILVPQTGGHLYEKGGLGGNEAHTRSFDIKGSGTMYADGVALVLLKRLECAVADGDLIQGVIKATAINNDGSLKVGYGAPSVQGQVEVIRMALEKSAINPRTIELVEGHGSATPLGDPIEVAALTKVYQEYSDEKQYCTLTSCKPNIGHLGRAAGITSLIKTVHCLQHGLIPGTLHFEQANPNLEIEKSPFCMTSQNKVWMENQDHPRRAAINNLGVGGTNTHLIVEQAPQVRASSPSRGHQLFVLSAKSPAALQRKLDQLENYVTENKPASNPERADIAYTLQVGRKHFEHRVFFLASSLSQLQDALSQRSENSLYWYHQRGASRPLTFAFSAPTDQCIDIARGLYNSEPYFKKVFEQCEKVILPTIGTSITHLLLDKQSVNGIVNTPSHRYALGFAVNFSIAKLLIEWQVIPAVLYGHGCGAFPAAAIAGSLSVEHAMNAGLYWVNKLYPEQSPENLDQDFLLAVINEKNHQMPTIPVLLEGITTEMPTQVLTRRDEFNWKDWITHSSVAMRNDKISTEQGATKQGTTKPSTRALNLLLADPNQLLVDWVGMETQTRMVSMFNKNCPQMDGQHHLLVLLGKLWLHGVNVNWKKIVYQEVRNRLQLPTYPFERKSHWIESIPKL